MREIDDTKMSLSYAVDMINNKKQLISSQKNLDKFEFKAGKIEFKNVKFEFPKGQSKKNPMEMTLSKRAFDKAQIRSGGNQRGPDNNPSQKAEDNKY